MTILTKTALVLTASLIGAVSAYGKTNIPDLARQCNSLGKAGACRELVKIATTNKDPNIRQQATEQLNDQAALANIAATDTSADVRLAAIGRITDQPLLGKFALEDKNPAIRQAAAQRVTDQNLLAKIAQARALEEQRTAAVRETLSAYLAAAAKLDPSATQAYLSPGCGCDLVVEFQANHRAGWGFSESETAQFLTPDNVTMAGENATVETSVVFHGGGTYMARQTRFFLKRENGNWRIFKIDPPPNAAGPGVSPL
jgi:hypothetical protein